MRTRLVSSVFAAVSALAIFLITLAGSAQATPSITPLNIVFPSVPVKQTSGPLMVTVVNPDTTPITLASIQLISNDFAQTNNCPHSLGKNVSCAFAIKFTPILVGSRVAGLTLTYTQGAQRKVVFVKLSGTGVTPPKATPTPTPTPIPTPTPTPTPTVTISGIAVQGPINGGLVSVAPVNPDGSNGSTLGTGATDSAGHFSIGIPPHTGPIRILVGGGSFVSEMDGATINASSSVLSALAPDGSVNVSNVSINPLSDFVNSRVLGLLDAGGTTLADATSNAPSLIEGIYGLSADPATIAPDYTAANINTDAGRLGLVLGALINEDQKLCPASPGLLANLLSIDISDGKFDGRHGASPIPYCGGALPSIAGTAAYRDALSGVYGLQLETAGFGFGGAYGPAANILLTQAPPVTPDLLLASLAGIYGGTTAAPDSLTGGSFAAAAGTAAMNVPREGATATLLPNGKVLIVGGLNLQINPGPQSESILASCELYDPVSNTFASAADTPTLTFAREAHTATLLPNGNVLIAGGKTDAQVVKSLELYDPATNSFSDTGLTLAHPRVRANATLLPNGKVLFSAGNTESKDTEIYDPVLNSLTTGPPLRELRAFSTATLLPTGQVLIAGGQDTVNSAVVFSKTTDLYEPVANTIAIGTSMNIGRSDAAAVVGSDGVSVFIVGGTVVSSTPGGAPTDSLETLHVRTGGFDLDFLTLARTDASAILLPNGRVLIVGGVLNLDAEVVPGALKNFTPPMNNFRVQEQPTVTLLPNGKVLVTGGVDFFGNSTATTELYTP